MKEYIFTYDLLKKIKDSGAVLCWKNITKEQLSYLYIKEHKLSSQIADLYGVSQSAVSSRRRAFGITEKQIVVNKFVEDEQKFLSEYLNTITKKEIEEISEITRMASSQYKKNKPNNIALSQKHKYLINNNPKLVNIISKQNLFMPAKTHCKTPYEIEAILGQHYIILDEIINDTGYGQWLCLYEKKDDKYFYSVLIPNEIKQDCFIDIMSDVQNPEADLYNLPRTREVIGKERIPKPLVFFRDFSNIKPSYIEILEEFRLFFNLFFDIKSGNYYKIHKDGMEEEVIVTDNNNVQVKLKYLKEFLTYKEMSLLFYFNIKKKTKNLLTDEHYLNETFSIKNIKYNVIILKENENEFTVRYYGKKLIEGFKNQEELTILNDNSGKYPDFVVDIDEYGNEIKFSCNPERLMYYDVEKSGISYNTKVFFKKDVLEKYYRDYKKYKINKNSLKCGNYYELPFRIEGKKHIAISLGDLGRFLNTNELSYWKSFNVPPDCIYQKDSRETFSKDFLFLEKFENFQKIWLKIHKWYLFKPLSKKEEYHLTTLHIPFADNQNEFDEQVRGLVKIIIDSVNEKMLKKIMNNSEIKGSISILEEYFKQINLHDYKKHITFLRKLQTLRSVGIAHRKSKQYEEISKYFRIDKKPLDDVFSNILNEIIKLIEVLNNHLKPENHKNFLL